MSFGGYSYGARPFGVEGATGADATGTVAWAEADDTFTIGGTLVVAGDAAWTESNDVVSIQGSSTQVILVDTHDGGHEPRKRRQAEWQKEREARDARKKQLSKLFGVSVEDEGPEVAERAEVVTLSPAAFAPRPTANDLRRIAKALRRERIQQEQERAALPANVQARAAPAAKEIVIAKDFEAANYFDEIEQDDEEILLLL